MRVISYFLFLLRIYLQKFPIQGKNQHWVLKWFGFEGTPLWLKCLAQAYGNPYYSERCAKLIFVVKGNGEQFKEEIDKFNGHRFELWKLKMEDILVNKDEWIIVDIGTALTWMLI